MVASSILTWHGNDTTLLAHASLSERYAAVFEQVLSFTPSDPIMSQGTWQFMSTRLLSMPGKAHELCDDLESLWFVLLFEGLHFVQHNSPSKINMAMIFDYAETSPKDGTHEGGVGKYVLYSANRTLMVEELEFDSKPFTTLIRKIYLVFKSLNAYYMALDDKETPNDSLMKSFRQLGSCTVIEELLKEALESKEWPTRCDKVDDQYPCISKLTFKEKETIGEGFVSSPIASGVKREREEEGAPPVSSEIKQTKMGPPPPPRRTGLRNKVNG